jgi:hypothetical protein
MRRPSTFGALVLGGALLAACAPDAIVPSRPYDEFLDRLAKSCHEQAIGPYTVDQLVRRSQSKHGNFFMDQTSRLYFGRINAQAWTSQMAGFLMASPEDPGIACVIRDYNETREWTTPAGEAPAKR